MDAMVDLVRRNMMKEHTPPCPKCGEPTSTEIDLRGEKFIVACICKCTQDLMDKEKQEAKEREKAYRREQMRDECFSINNGSAMTFDKDDGMTPQLNKMMKNYAVNFETFKPNGQGLLLYGNVGTGKTFYSAAIANELIDNNYSVIMTDFPTVIAKIQRDAFKKDHIKKLVNCDLLVIDDLGVERQSEYMQEQVYSIINSRYKECKPMVISTNLSADELKNPQSISSKRIYERILERCLPVKFDGVNRRKAKADYSGMLEILNG